MAETSAPRPLWIRFALPLVVLAVALFIGSGVLSGKPQTSAQRASAIESVVRCPSCIDVSVAQSQASTAITVRHEIERLVAQGRSTAQIKQKLVSQYGQTILLEPPSAGGFAIIWIVPIVLGAGALGVIGVLFWRRSRQFSATRDAITADSSTDDASTDDAITADSP
jgi:cytochrome c-type biogenesis protein CcmH/NrfF